jgi:hypothetical protein
MSSSFLTPPLVRLGDKVVIALSIGTKVSGSNPDEDDGFLRTIKIRINTCFGGEVKLSTPCRNILQRVEKLCGVRKRNLIGKIHSHF